MIAEGTFAVADFTPLHTVTEIVTALPAGYSTMIKTYSGDVEGRSITQFTAAFDPASGTGTYVALESFEGLLAGKTGAFNFVHSASTTGSDRENYYGLIVPHSGTGELATIAGTAELRIEADGTHRMSFDYTL